MKHTFSAIILASLIVAAPARAAYVKYQFEDLNILYPGNQDLTGTLTIELAAPSVPPYIGSGTFSLNGAPLTSITNGPGFIYDIDLSTKILEFITFPTPPPGRPGYGHPLKLTASNIFLNGVPGQSGSVVCSGDCVSPVPLPSAFPLFATALAGLASVGWWKRRLQKGSFAPAPQNGIFPCGLSGDNGT
jgi:hypothetical protein